jgi:branched-chain amino acid transport system substrate-binding protein
VLADEDPFDTPLAQIVAGDAERAGIQVRGQDTIPIVPGSSFTGEVAKIVQSGAQAVFVSATATSEAARLVRQLHASVSRMPLLASSTMLNTVFTSNLGAAEGATFLGSPILATRLYPPSARRVLAQYSRRFAGSPEPYALYGYEAMSVLLAAIRAAGARGDDRKAVIESFFATHDRSSVLGVYSMRPSGETTLSSYAIDRVTKGEPVFWRSLQVSP